MVKLRGEDILDVEVPIPSVRAQMAIVASHDRLEAKMDGLAATLQEQIGLLKERRQALITAAVTGEIEV